MSKRSNKKNKDNKHNPNAPGNDCKCPVCIFTKSQAPGNPYDLTNCPKLKPQTSSKKNNKTKPRPTSGTE
ncbi:MAG: hypothetical protein KAI43_02310 [Candidatus Aureabacteria bacterium]|nr:hypothetical protein [Candidatus Auribacterota bacterium]